MVEKTFPLPYRELAITIRLCCFLYTLSLILAYNPPPIFYEHDKMGWHEKRTMVHLSEDLFKDSLLKMRQIVHIRQVHDKLVAFNIGMIMGGIREKYRHMLEIYRDIIVSYRNWSVARPPGVKYFRSFHLIIALEMMHYLELEIDKLVDVIIEETAEDVKNKKFMAGETAMVKQVGKQKGKQEGTQGNTTIPPMPQPDSKRLLRGGVERHEEEAEKSLMRQRYLMKKLGHSINMTTMKKRFIRHWPVEDSWKLDKYNYNYK